MKGRRNILFTGGAGFIGSHVVKLFVEKYPDYRVVVLDKLTYAGNLANLADIQDRPNYSFVRGDICDYEGVKDLFRKYEIDGVIHLAAESHVDRSIDDPFIFARTNVLGTLTLLQTARDAWESQNYRIQRGGIDVECRFHHISTDEVYGSLEITYPHGKQSWLGAHGTYGEELFREDTPYAPHSPYSASKASSDHFVRAFHDTYGLPVVISNCSNNYGPNQFPEKLIPLLINNIRLRKPLPVYGTGDNVRDWLYVIDHASAIDAVFHHGRSGESYNIGGFNEWKNIDVVKTVVRVVDRLLGREEGEDMGLITYVTDRKGHDRRYAIDSTKLRRELGWEPSVQFEEGITKTARWYLDNQDWLDSVTSGDYMNYYEKMYGNRLRHETFNADVRKYKNTDTKG